MQVLKFSSATCMPCKQLALTITNLSPEQQDLFVDYTSENNIDKFKEYNVRAVPTLIVVNESGGEIRRATGSMTKDKLIEFIGP